MSAYRPGELPVRPGMRATIGTEAITKPPGFVAPAKENFKLRPDSPAHGFGAL